MMVLPILRKLMVKIWYQISAIFSYISSCSYKISHGKTEWMYKTAWVACTTLKLFKFSPKIFAISPASLIGIDIYFESVYSLLVSPPPTIQIRGMTINICKNVLWDFYYHPFCPYKTYSPKGHIFASLFLVQAAKVFSKKSLSFCSSEKTIKVHLGSLVLRKKMQKIEVKSMKEAVCETVECHL